MDDGRKNEEMNLKRDSSEWRLLNMSEERDESELELRSVKWILERMKR